MGEAIVDPKALTVTNIAKMLEKLQQSNSYLEDIQKGLNNYLEKKRLFFPRYPSSNLSVCLPGKKLHYSGLLFVTEKNAGDIKIPEASQWRECLLGQINYVFHLMFKNKAGRHYLKPV